VRHIAVDIARETAYHRSSANCDWTRSMRSHSFYVDDVDPIDVEQLTLDGARMVLARAEAELARAYSSAHATSLRRESLRSQSRSRGWNPRLRSRPWLTRPSSMSSTCGPIATWASRPERGKAHAYD
jgi:hypothetical protein